MVSSSTKTEEIVRVPDAAVRIFDARFERYRLQHARVERLGSGMRWAEGPVWIGDGRYLLFTDLPNDRIMRWDETTEELSVFRQPAGRANGLTRDRQGRLIACEHDGRRVTRTEYDGTITVLADHYNGAPLNSPNDAVVASDDGVWFTDPPFGLTSDYMGRRAKAAQTANIYRIDPSTGDIQCKAKDLEGPNGLAFSPDEQVLYLVESRAVPRRIVAYDVVDGDLTERRVLIDTGEGTPDGLRVDEDGNLWCGWGSGSAELDGVRIFLPDGTPIAHIDLPERCANLCFGGAHRNRLFMAATGSLYALYVNTAAAV